MLGYSGIVGTLDLKVLSYQEGVENNVTISTVDIQSAKVYRSTCCTLRNGETNVGQLFAVNQFFDAISRPTKCGDLRLSQKGDITLWTISRQEIRKMIRPFVIYPVLYFPLAIYSHFKFVNYDFGWNETQVHPYLHFFDCLVFTFLSLVGIDNLTIRIRRIPRNDAIIMLLCTLGIFLVKLTICIFGTSHPLRSFINTFSFSAPFILSSVPFIYGLNLYPKALFWYWRSTNWFYNNIVVKKTGGFLRKCVDWITNYYSLNGVQHDSSTRCAIN
ncbi:predicted protein [Naegleria gruberi]|uniref:Predicted protein n=1 Tax=Naegleria gruberi TaxID=5762 RepID=D2V9F1_NAEGR|nr:uncharacterized protein NAEGRDRAFT_65419 [Naegleria gruberi]EFC46450.1 predicted protein [Naegleria gruberi]|eukprot:XP_002679194.1 predicted protein [Naegleria gruberi strain NEG-M]